MQIQGQLQITAILARYPKEFQSEVNDRGNVIDKMLKRILVENLKVKLANRGTRHKIDMFKKHKKSLINKYSGDFDELAKNYILLTIFGS